jgi:hypothetical protein
LGEAVFRSDTPCIIIKAAPQAPLLWALAQRSCADGAFLSFREGEVHLHIVELKSKITLGTWAKVVQQFEGMFLTALAVARLLELRELARVTCYLAGTVDAITDAPEGASLILSKAPVGKWRTFGHLEAWNKNQVPLPLAVEATLVKGWKNDAGVADFGPVS